MLDIVKSLPYTSLAGSLQVSLARHRDGELSQATYIPELGAAWPIHDSNGNIVGKIHTEG